MRLKITSNQFDEVDKFLKNFEEFKIEKFILEPFGEGTYEANFEILLFDENITVLKYNEIIKKILDISEVLSITIMDRIYKNKEMYSIYKEQ